MSTNVLITNRDLDIFAMIARLRFLTLNQIAALFYDKHDGYNLEMKKSYGTLSKRVSLLARAGFLVTADISFFDGGKRRAYLLGKNAIDALKDIREEEDFEAPGWLQRKHTAAVWHGPHHVLVSNFLINLLLLSKLREDFSVDDWIADRDCRYYIKKGDQVKILDPDLYLCVQNGSPDPIPMLLELDRGTVSSTVIRRKAHRVFEYYATDRHPKEIGFEYFPRVLFITPDRERRDKFAKEINKAKENYRGKYSKNIASFPFWLATYDDVDINSIDQGRVTDKPLDPVWVKADGELGVSPFAN